MRRGIVMIGPRRDVRGGISAMANVCFEHGLFGRWDARYLATHRDGTKLAKACQAAVAFASFLGELLSGRVALLHVHIASGASFWRKSLFIVAAHALRVPYVLHMHGGNFTGFYRARSPLSQRFIRWIYRKAERVIALSDQWREAILAVQPAARVGVIANPVQIPPWQAALDGPAPRVVFLGVLAERKGVHDLLRAWPAVLRGHPDARLVLGGSGDAASVAALARELGVESSIEMPGWLTGEAKARLLRDAWAFALPSHFEALPMSVLEAMAAGVPVVATRVGGIPAAVEDGVTGMLVAPGDVEALAAALLRILGDATARRAMGAASRRAAVERFSAAVLVPRIEAVWRELAPEAEKGAPMAARGAFPRA